MSYEDRHAGISWSRAAWILFRKDLRAELRTKVALSAVGLFTFSSLLLLALATATLKETRALSETRFYEAFDRMHGRVDDIKQIVDLAIFPAWSDASKLSMLWVLLCFAAFAGLSHSFVHEEETGTTLALRIAMPPAAVYAGKLLFNLVILVAVALLVTPFYMTVTGMRMGNPVVFIALMLSGCLGLAGAATIIAALAAKAQSTGALYGAIGLPLLVVFLILLLNAANTLYPPASAFVETGGGASLPVLNLVKDIGGLLSYGIALIAISAVTFHFVWEE